MSETVMNLVNAIKAGDAIATEQAFAAAMADKLGTHINDMRQTVASTMFNQPEQLEAEENNLEQE